MLRSIFIKIVYKVLGLFLVVGYFRVIICLHQKRKLAFKGSSYTLKVRDKMFFIMLKLAVQILDSSIKLIHVVLQWW